MGYSHGQKWNDKKIKQSIFNVMKTAKIETFPTHSLMKEVTGNEALSNAISKHGGSKYWAEKLGIEIKKCESKFGYEFECECIVYLTTLGYECELTKARYPYDILANNNIKIDVKSGHLYHGEQGNFYTFNLEKEKPTCDIFVCYCIEDNEIKKVYVIPSCVVSGKTQLSIGVKHSKYDRYIDNWTIFKKYKIFYESLECF